METVRAELAYHSCRACLWLSRKAEAIEEELMRTGSFLTLVGVVMGAMQCAERVLA